MSGSSWIKQWALPKTKLLLSRGWRHTRLFSVFGQLDWLHMHVWACDPLPVKPLAFCVFTKSLRVWPLMQLRKSEHSRVEVSWQHSHSVTAWEHIGQYEQMRFMLLVSLRSGSNTKTTRRGWEWAEASCVISFHTWLERRHCGRHMGDHPVTQPSNSVTWLCSGHN